MNPSKIQDMLLDLKTKQYVESEVTHTLSQNSVPLISISYSKSDNVFKIKYPDNHEIELYAKIESAMDAITSELKRHK
ncbi:MULTISPECIES: hypothetical protein [Fictibacillus]|uniref:Uncharacterized protein n=1 Tax=Fictibacillus terranigra TaxID=3058424 RepID=A0ABT8E8L9_9BACL|nr:hypothetical protein [Fictibacillus sp. CENA-BCM004]MDN4074262.1 hypothetical protein [Fictibacillus sp. CENA-BCM004]